jgi:hypothetical protein
MTKFFTPLCLIAILLFTACGNPPETETTVTNTSTPQSTFSPDSGTLGATTTNSNVQTIPSSGSVQAQPNTSTASATKVNPPHGQPGHICESEVGTPAKGATQTQQVLPTQTTLPTAKPATGKGLNPAHGAPGHRCDIEVGAPLSSAPKQTVAPTVQTQPSPVVPTATTNGSAKLNPAHGQPGHDCAIPVGQPLKGN